MLALARNHRQQAKSPEKDSHLVLDGVFGLDGNWLDTCNNLGVSVRHRTTLFGQLPFRSDQASSHQTLENLIKLILTYSRRFSIFISGQRVQITDQLTLTTPAPVLGGFGFISFCADLYAVALS